MFFLFIMFPKISNTSKNCGMSHFNKIVCFKYKKIGNKNYIWNLNLKSCHFTTKTHEFWLKNCPFPAVSWTQDLFYHKIQCFGKLKYMQLSVIRNTRKSQLVMFLIFPKILHGFCFLFLGYFFRMFLNLKIFTSVSYIFENFQMSFFLTLFSLSTNG